MHHDYPSDWDERRKRVYRRDNYACGNCGVRGGPRGTHQLEAHHIVPLAKGGTNDIENLRTLCYDCHTAIHNDSAYAPTRTDSRGSDGDLEELGPYSFLGAIVFSIMFVLTILVEMTALFWVGIVAIVVGVIADVCLEEKETGPGVTVERD
ncbi:HNH endonuclease [Natrarchaeobius chitinivorans]|uniref:HNH endonuclease n=1 Tax=Natrarchaeobius chitinivorans TaxID=1679083 RepID=A0A3N6MBC6_NATCH|nr:HNH endonuclease [Natrarchaeobius chitinivorans]